MLKNRKTIFIIILIFAQLFISNQNTHASSYPIISNIVHTPINPSSQDRVTVLANISNTNGLSDIKVEYVVDLEDNWNSIDMENYFGDTFYSHIPPHSDSSQIFYRIRAVSTSGIEQLSSNYSYRISDNISPIITEIKRTPLVPLFDEVVNISAIIHDISGINSAFLKYRFNQEEVTSVPLIYNSVIDLWEGFIPNSPINTSVVYWIEAENVDLISSESRFFSYVSVGYKPYLYELWHSPDNIQENGTMSFHASLYSRCIVEDGKIYYKINQGQEQTLNFNRIDEISWISEPITENQLNGGDIIEYWCQFNYSHDGSYDIYPEFPVHQFVNVNEYIEPVLNNVVISPVYVNKGDIVAINVSVTDQSTLTVDCVVSSLSQLNDTYYIMVKIPNSNIWTTNINTEFLPEDESIIITLKAIDINNIQSVIYSGFFINDGSPPILYNIEDLRESRICHTYEQTLFVYVNDKSEINYVKLYLWLSNGTQYYDEFLMEDGGEHLYYFTLNSTPLQLSPFTWITYRFEAEDIHGYNVSSPYLTFYVGDYTGPAFKDFDLPSDIGYQENPEIRVKTDDNSGAGVQAVSIIYSDDNWNTNQSLEMNFESDNWWKISEFPKLELGSARNYYFSAIDWQGNPSKSFIHSYSSIDCYPPSFDSWILNDGEQVDDTTTSCNVELWLDDPNNYVLDNVNITFYSLKENKFYTYNLVHISNNHFQINIDYDWIAHDLIIYFFEAEDQLYNYGKSDNTTFTVFDTIAPNINPTIIYGNNAWKNIQSSDEDPNNIYSNSWLIDFQYNLDVSASVEDDTLVEVRLYYGTDGITFTNYFIMDENSENVFETLISTEFLTSIYLSSANPALTHELLFLKIWAIDNASHVSEYNLWDDSCVCYELYDYSSPILYSFIVPTGAYTGEYPTFSVSSFDYKNIENAKIRFSYGVSTTSWFNMELVSGSHRDGTWNFNSWQAPLDHDGTVNVHFQFTDAEGVLDLGYWQHKDTPSQISTDFTHSFVVIDSIKPIISDHYFTPTDPEYSEQFRFYTEVEDDCSGLDEIWVEWWKNDIHQTNIHFVVYLENLYRTDFIGTFSYNTKIKYIIHAEDYRGNIASTTPIIFYIEDNVIPVISNIYHIPNPIYDSENYISVFSTASDEGSEIDHVTVKWYRNGFYQNNRYMSFSNGQWSYSIYIGNWNVGDELKYKIYCYDGAGNYRISGLYGPYTLIDNTPPSISGVVRNPTSVYTNDLVTVSATVTDSGSGLSWVRLYYKHGPSGTWYYDTMSYSSGKYYGSFNAYGVAGITDYYYIKAKDNANKYKQSSTYTYVVQQSSGGGGWFQPTITGNVEDVDYDISCDEGVLFFSKEQFSFYPNELTNFIILKYQYTGSPYWHSVVTIDNNTHYSAYISSSVSLRLNYKLIIHLNSKQIIYSDIRYIDLIDHTSPTLNIKYLPELPQANDIIYFHIEAYDASGIEKVKCLISLQDSWEEHILERFRFGYIFRLDLHETVYLRFLAIDNNGLMKSTEVIEFIVLCNDLDTVQSAQYETIVAYFLFLVLSIFGGGVLIFNRNKTNQFRRISK